MPNQQTSFTKLVAPPSATAWAQTYHAGNVYAVVSVEEQGKKQDPEHALPSVLVTGKEIINNLEAEYFAIAEKSLHTIKEAVQNACKEIPETVASTVIFAVLHDQTLYLFLYGPGHVFIKRQEKFGTLLEGIGTSKEVAAASGKLVASDVVILSTKELLAAVPKQELIENLSYPVAELGERLTPKIDDEKYAGAAALIFSFKGSSETPSPSVIARTKDEARYQMGPDEAILSKPPQRLNNEIATGNDPSPLRASLKDGIARNDVHQRDEPKMDLDAQPQIEADTEKGKEKPKLPLSFPRVKLSRWRVFFLCLTVILMAILVVSIMQKKGKQQQAQDLTAFNTEFSAAKQHYDEGKSLISLNKSLALDDFTRAKQTLEDLQTKVQTNSPQEAQIHTLLDSIDQELNGAANIASITLSAADTSVSKLLAAEIANASNTYFAKDDAGKVYTIDQSGIANTDDVKHSLVTNQKDWTTLGGFGTYLGNFYVLDTSASQVFKFTKTASNYSKTNYFSAAPDLSKAVSLTIDGSIWILSSDGTINQFTKGKADQFSIQGLQLPLKQPTRIFTTADMDNLYVLDNGNSRVVVIKKADGSIVGDYRATEIKSAKDIDADEKSKKIYLLINNKISAIDMK